MAASKANQKTVREAGFREEGMLGEDKAWSSLDSAPGSFRKGPRNDFLASIFMTSPMCAEGPACLTAILLLPRLATERFIWIQ